VKEVIIPITIDDPAPVYKDSVVYDKVKIENLRRDIFFIINRTDIQESEAYKVQEIVDFMNKYPSATVTIDGYADAGTGNDQINDRLAAGRADVVVKALVDKGISQDRITYDSHGSRVQPFAENDLNRVSICIADPKATEDVPRTIRVRVQ
jgi:outer membrane protein OmpA-like peptidoglycan-associated protein